MKDELPELTAEHKARISEWADALDSGRYHQGVGGLRSASGRYCVLGVGCDVAKETLGLSWKRHPHIDWFEIGAETSCLPQRVADYYGLSTDPVVDMGDGKGLESAASLNDHHTPFFTLSQMLRSTYLGGGFVNIDAAA